MQHDYSGKVAIVTGGGSGIGQATAIAFAAAGASVVVADLDNTALDDTVRTIKDSGGEATGVRTDVASAADTRDDGSRRRRHLRRPRLRVQQRGHRSGAVGRGRRDRGGMGPRLRDQRQGRVALDEVRDPGDAGPGWRRDRQRVVDPRAVRCGQRRGVQRHEARGGRPHPVRGPRLCPAGDPGQRHVARA